jgi:cysteine desulfurase/selenocysteine lyase
MAAEFFGALPGTQQAGQTLVATPPAAPSTAIPVVGASRLATPPAAIPVPQPSLPAAPASAFAFLEDVRPLFGGRESSAILDPGTAGVVSPALPLSAAQPPVPAIPGSVPALNPSAAAFSFLEDVRPFGGLESTASLDPGTAGAASPALPLSAAQPPVPAIPGSVPALNPSAAPAFSFLEDVRPFGGLDSTASPDPGLSGVVPPAANAALAPGSTNPGSAPAIYPSAVPSFSFLEDVRPLFQTPENSSVAALTSAPAVPARLQDIGGPPSPTVPGGFGALDSAVPFSFLEEARPLFSYPPSAPGPVPVLEPGAARSAPAPLNLSSQPFDVEAIRRDFPILQERVNGRPLVWLDSAATSQKPQSVIDRLSYFYAHENSNVHRAAHELAARATDAYESAREKVRRFLNASAAREIVFVRGATEGINLVAQGWGRQNIHEGDEIVITWLEHHANIVPWQMLCSEKGARLRVAPVDDGGQVILEEYEKLLGPKTRLVSLAQVSNALGTVTPASEMVEAAHRHGARVLVDGAQAVSHMRVDVQSLDCDFYVFSGHKVFAPTGIGVVYGKPEVLEFTRPWQGGGNMIQDVTFEKTVYQPPPARFEAGTGNIADAVGLGAAIDYLDRVGMANVTHHEGELLRYGTEALQQVPGLRIIGTAREKAGVLSFVLDGVRTEEIGDYLNREGIAVRAGHHCAQPIHRRFGIEATVRASLALYNNCSDLDALAAALHRLQAARRHRG